MTPIQTLSAIIIFFAIGFIYGYLIGNDKKQTKKQNS